MNVPTLLVLLALVAALVAAIRILRRPGGACSCSCSASGSDSEGARSSACRGCSGASGCPFCQDK